jgi:hypothetical protein
MSAHVATRLAWSLWALAVVPGGAALAVSSYLGGRAGLDPAELAVRVATLLLLLPLLAFATVGALVASRRPEHPIGWLCCGSGISLGATLTMGFLAPVIQPGSLLSAAALAAGPLFVLWIGQVQFLLLLFPTGRLPSPRWRPAAWLVVVAWGLVALASELSLVIMWMTAGDLLADNPRGLAPLAAADAFTVLTAVGGVGYALALLSLFVAASAPLVRLRRARGVERQQLKWFIYAAAAAAVLYVGIQLALAYIGSQAIAVAETSNPDLRIGAPAWQQISPWQQVGDILSRLQLLPFGLIPVAVGIAILKHRLYDIDRLVNRTLVYGALTAGLGLLYWGGVILLQQILRPLTQGSELAIAGSTLAVWALFRPARWRIQAAVNRRFYRGKYDAAQTLEAFSARLQQEVDLDAMTAELLAIVHQTLQPAEVSLWLRPGAVARQHPS